MAVSERDGSVTSVPFSLVRMVAWIADRRLSLIACVSCRAITERMFDMPVSQSVYDRIPGS